MNHKRLYLGLGLLGLMAVATAAITVQRVLIRAAASNGSGQFVMNLQAMRIYHDTAGERLLGQGSFVLTQGDQRYPMQLQRLTAMEIFELEDGVYRITLEGSVRFAPALFTPRSQRPVTGTFRLVVFDYTEDSESDSVEFRLVTNQGRRYDFFGEVSSGVLHLSP
jgi:hypothetical protein